MRGTAGSVTDRRILHVITDLNVGGAETMLYRLVQVPEMARCEHRVVSLTSPGAIGDRLRQLGIESLALGMGRFPSPLKIVRLARIVRDFRPAVVLSTGRIHRDVWNMTFVGGETCDGRRRHLHFHGERKASKDAHTERRRRRSERARI